MKHLTTLLITLIFTVFMLAACGGDSGTGPDSDNGNGTTYTVNVSAGDGGLVSPSGASDYDEGEALEVLASSDGEYTFSGWTGDVQGSDNPLSLTVDQDYDITANFQIKSYALTVNTDGQGDVDEEVVQQNKDFESGTVVKLTANPPEGWKFVEWQGAITGSTNPDQLTVDNPKQVTAVFESTFKLASNGVTITCEEAGVGEQGTVNSTTYTKREKGDITTGNALTTCTSGITDMSRLFRLKDTFNEDISHWDVSSVENMEQLFFGASSFNGDIAEWNVSSVTDMRSMFLGARSFNQYIGGWDVSSVTKMRQMFVNADSFNQYIGGWDVASVTNMNRMFANANVFNQNLSGWCVDPEPDHNDFATGSSVLDPGNEPDWGNAANCPGP